MQIKSFDDVLVLDSLMLWLDELDELELIALSDDISRSQSSQSSGLIWSSHETPSIFGKQITFLHTLEIVPSGLHSMFDTTSTQQ